MDEINGFELKLGKYSYLFYENVTIFNNTSSARISANKYCCNQLLNNAGVPVPKSILVDIDEFQAKTFKEKIATLKFPLVIKPLYGTRGIDVLCNIKTLEELEKFLTHFFTLYSELLIEEYHGNLKSYRVLIFNKKVLGVVRRYPASIVGDGKHNIQELIELTNIERQKINKYIGPIVVNDECQISLRELGITTAYIPLPGERIVLSYTSNATRGGNYRSLGKQICKENRKLMIKITTLLNLNLAGIDIECVDINKPIESTDGVVIEVNHQPNIRIHELPMYGTPNFVTRKIMRTFIYRHPLSYLFSLYSNKPTSFLIRTLILINIIGIIYVISH